MTTIIDEIRKELEANSDNKTKESGQHFFKEQIMLYGVKTASVTKISKAYFKQLKGKTKAEIFNLCDTLWQSGYMEESFIACHWSYTLRKDFEAGDFEIFEKWISKYVTNWASCDTLCNHTVGEFIEMFPEFLSRLKEFAKSENRWMRRAAAVTLIIPAREGKFLNDILEIADILLLDNDDLVQKGYGWMLKAASQAHQKEIFDYVLSKKAIMPRTALRYSIEKMPEELKTIAMEK
ncbi:MAG: DNA alkylation repair protein [Bacteroidota bacterium]